MKSALILAFIAMPFFAEAKALQKTLEKYSGAATIQFDIHKIDEKIILGTKSESSGLLKFQKNKIYLLQEGEKKVEIFYVDRTLSLVEYPDADFGPDGKRKITILKNTSPPLIKSLLSLFSNPKTFAKEFSVVSEKSQDDLLVIELKPKQKNIKNLVLKIKSTDSSLIELSFVDDVETKTTLQFSNLKLNTKMKTSDFHYKSLKTDEVMTQ